MTNPSSPAITAVDVRMSFGDNVVLDGLELTVEQGSVFALLGPNGAGKTTMVRILATLLEADHGTIRSPDTTSCARPTRSAPRSV